MHFEHSASDAISCVAVIGRRYLFRYFNHKHIVCACCHWRGVRAWSANMKTELNMMIFEVLGVGIKFAGTR